MEIEKATQEERDEMLKKLKSEHQALEARLTELERHISLTPEEQVERAHIKKLKLQKKDLIAALSRKPAG